MNYCYREQRSYVFTEEGQVTFLKIRDEAQRLLKEAGAVMLIKLLQTGDVWNMTACVDRLVELGELVELERKCMGQHRVFINGKSK